jgi:hypothetical protein
MKCEINMSISLIEVLFRDRITSESESETLKSVLDSIGGAIAAVERNRQQVEETDIDDPRFVLEDSAFINDLLGCAFVACQAHIARVVATVEDLREIATNNNIVYLRKRDKQELMGFGRRVSGTEHTMAQAIDAFANYYKHHDEWGPDWSKATTRGLGNINVIWNCMAVRGFPPRNEEDVEEAVSAKRAQLASAWSLERGMDALGLNNSEVAGLAENVANWRSETLKIYLGELRPH